MAKVLFNNQDNIFFQSLRTTVDEYFTTNHIKKTGNFQLFFKTFFFISSAIIIYALLIFCNLNAITALLLCILLGFILAGIGFCVMHDSNHGSYSSKQWVNNVVGLSANALGVNGFFWKQKHNILHHTFTNVDGLDDDIAKSPIIRQCESQKWVPAHKFQHLYLLPIYSLSTIFWVFIMDFSKYFTHKIKSTDLWKMNWKNHLIFWATKISYVTFYMVIPMIIWGFVNWLIGFLVMNAVLGLTLSLVFQLAHVVENTEFEEVALDQTKHIETTWAVHQIKTTSNFAMNNPMISWMVGGLNFQIEHHLFPKISHVHYPAISKIVIKKCSEFNLPYNHFDTFIGALSSHFRMMRKLGKKNYEL